MLRQRLNNCQFFNFFWKACFFWPGISLFASEPYECLSEGDEGKASYVNNIPRTKTLKFEGFELKQGEILETASLEHLLSHSIPEFFKQKNSLLNKKGTGIFSDSHPEPFDRYGCLERQDHIRLHNILYLLANKEFSTPKKRGDWLKNLSLQFDALSVYEDMIRHVVDTAFGPNKGLMAKVLSFLHYGLQSADLNPVVKEHIVCLLTESSDLELLRVTLKEIIDLDYKRHKMLNQRKKWLERIEYCKRLPLLPLPSKFEDTSYEELRWKISNTPDLEKIRQEIANPMVLKEEMETQERFNRAIEILKTGADTARFPELYQAIEMACESIKQNRLIFQSLKKKILGQKYFDIEVYGGLLYEYENLNIIYNQGSSFLSTFAPQDTESRYQLIQLLSVISEGLNGLFLPLGPGQPQEEIIVLRGVLSFLRNKVFEHPSPIRQKKLDELMVHSFKTIKIFERLSTELGIILQKIEARRDYLHGIISGQNNWQDDLLHVFKLYKKGGKLSDEAGIDEHNKAPDTLGDFDKLKIWKSSELPLLQSLRRYFIYSSLKIEDITDDNEKIQHQKQNILSFRDRPFKETPDYTWDDLTNALNAMKQYIGVDCHRDALYSKLKGGLENRLKAKGILNQLYQILRYLLEHPLKSGYFDKIKPTYQKAFEYFYLNLRDQRNFQTHDLWRPQDEDLNRLANVMLYTLTMMKQAFEAQEDPIPQQIKAVQKFNRAKWRTKEEIESFLQKEKINVHSLDNHFSTLLHHAVLNQNLEMAKVLLELGANIHSMDYKGRTPLNYAASYGNKELIECLLEAGALPDIKDNAGDDTLTLILDSCSSDHTEEKKELVNLIKEYTSTSRRHNADALHGAVKSKDIKEVKTLLQEGYHPSLYDAEGELPLILSMKEEVPTDIALPIASMLLNNGAPIDQMIYSEGIRALYYAAWDNDPSKVDFLLRNGAKPSMPEEEAPLSQAIFTSKESARLLLEGGADPSVKGTDGNSLLTSLMNSYSRQADTVTLLLNYKANPNSCDEFGTSLHNVLEHNGQQEAARVLLEAGAAPFVKGWGGLYADKTPFSVAQKHLKPFLQEWLSKNAKIIATQVEEAIQSYPWSTFWKKRVLSLYNGYNISLTEENIILHAQSAQGPMKFQVANEKDPNNFYNIDPEEAVNLLLSSINTIQHFLAKDLLEDRHDFLPYDPQYQNFLSSSTIPQANEKISQSFQMLSEEDSEENEMEESEEIDSSDFYNIFHPEHEELLSLMKDLKRKDRMLEMYRKVYKEDFDLSTDHDCLNDPSLTPYPEFRNYFTSKIADKENLEKEISTLLLKDHDFLKRYLNKTIKSGKWLKATPYGTGILQAYAFLKGFNLVFWNATDEPSEFDIISKSESLGTSAQHLMYPIDEKECDFIVLKTASF